MNLTMLERKARVAAMWQEAAWMRIRSQIRFAEHLAATDLERQVIEDRFPSQHFPHVFEAYHV